MTEALVISFQTQLSAVMETVLKTTMYEVTRLVEENFLEQVDRGKREVEVLRRRLILSEAKLRERERFKRVRCVDCGRTAVSKRRMLNRSFETQGGLEQRAVIKQEKDSVEAPKAGEVKEETTNRDACIVIRSQKHSQTDTSTSETNGNADPDRKSLKDIACGPAERSGDEDEMKRKNQAKWFDPTSDRIGSVSLTDPVGVSPSPEADGSRQQLSCTDSGQVKPEVVVMLPPDWEEMERITPQVVSDTMPQLEVQRGDPFITRSQEEKQVPQLPVTVQRFTPQAMQNLQQANQPGRSLVKKNARIVLKPRTVGSDQDAVPIDRVNPVCKSLPASIPSHVRQFPEGAGERSFSTINPGRSVLQGVGIRVQGDTRNILQRTVHSCNQCGKGFSHLCHLRAHEQIHTGERQFCCTICGRSFTKLSNLKAHRRVHTGERPYICTDCGKRFTQKCNLKRHQRIHSDFTNSNT